MNDLEFSNKMTEIISTLIGKKVVNKGLGEGTVVEVGDYVEVDFNGTIKTMTKDKFFDYNRPADEAILSEVENAKNSHDEYLKEQRIEAAKRDAELAEKRHKETEENKKLEDASRRKPNAKKSFDEKFSEDYNLALLKKIPVLSYKNVEADPNYTKGPKVIFLDVDGVLNCRSTKDKCGAYRGIDDKKVSLLKEIVDATGAIIVLISSWKEWWTNNPRYKPKQDEMATYLDEKLAKQGLVIRDKTRDGNPFKRGKGILRFIERQKEIGIDIRKYVILDDEIFDYLEAKMSRHLIRTNFEQNGLEKKHVRKAIEKLR